MQTLPVAADPSGRTFRFDDLKQRVNLESRTPSEAAPLPGVMIGPDARFIAQGALATGYDSNIDYLTTGNGGGAYGLTDLGMALVVGPANAQTTAVVRGGYGYHDIENRPDRWDAGALIDHYRVIAPDTAIDFGAFYLHDDIDVDANERAAGYYELTRRNAQHDLFLRGRILDTNYLSNPNDPQTQSLYYARDATFDNLLIQQSAGLLLLKDQRLAPYFEVGYGHLDYNHELNPAVFSRDGDEIWTVGGVRVTFNDRLHIDLGARYNQRWLDDPTISSYDSVFFDGKLVWAPTDQLYFEANIDRTFTEPIDDQALFTESTSYSLLTVANIDPRTRLSLDVGYQIDDQIGDAASYREIYGEARLTYEVDTHTEMFGSLLGSNSRNTDDGEEANRVNVMVGIRFTN
ncbi:MAG: outer membrane beta-barrel protein [Hyphomicrobiaceae bacterium]|nr:outer membrane beta-barrel protein [Hyphomicrobiaceae bacterium]